MSPRRIAFACRAAFLALGTSALLGTGVHTALAGDNNSIGASCSDNPAECTVNANDPGNQALYSSVGNNPGITASSSSGGVQVSCTDAPYFPTSADQAEVDGQHPPNSGHYVVRTCSAGHGDPDPSRTLVWIPNGVAALPDPEVLAAQAESKLTLPTPTIDASPAVGLPQVVQLPTWTWLPQAQWTALSATAAVPGESVTATATPVSVAWSWGDGTTSVCQGPGIPFAAETGDASAPSPTCGHTYQVTSAQVPGQQFAVTATVSWAISWSGGGAAGTFPDLSTSSTVRWTVSQIQSIQINAGS